MKNFLKSIFAAALCCLLATPSRSADIAKTPILVELFTSEGCSSCPPADAWLQKLDCTQPLTNAQIIVLSEHVDYWDHDGWKDPYSSHSVTERQSDYVNALRLETAYTPQIVIDGARELRPEDMKQAGQEFQKALASEKVSVRITSLNVTPAGIRAHVEVDGSNFQHGAHLYLAAALDHAESQVLRGENGGRHLTHVAVARALEQVGNVKKGQSFSGDVELKFKPAIEPSNLRVIAFVQENGPGKVIGAAMRKVGEESVPH